jgi:ATP-binding cassette subfamily B protein
VRVARLQALVSPAGSIAVQGAFLAVLGLGGYRVATGSIAVADLVAFILYLFLLVMPLGQAIGAWTQLQNGLGALARVQEVLALEPEDDARPERGGTVVAVPPGPPSPEVPLLELDDVSFRYPDGTDVLRGVSLTVPAGHRVALVGPSGAGKSTVLGAGRGLLPADRRGGALGRHRRPRPAAGRPARPAGLRRAGGAGARRLLPRQPAPGRAARDRPRAVGGAGRRRAHRGGAALAARPGRPGGGRRRAAVRRRAQRLAIARSLLARPALLLLDEPTASLDARNEALLRDTLAAASADRALLVVAHRLSTVLDSDTIVVLDAGRVVASGPHEELLETSPLYRELAAAQLLV